MFMKLLSLFLIIALSGCFKKNNKQDEVDAVLIHASASIGVKAPMGWEPVGATSLGLCAVYALKGKNFHNSPSVIYPRIVDGESIEHIIEINAADLKSRSPEFKLEKKENYKSKKNLDFVIRYFMNGPKPGAFEAVGYLKHKDHYLILVYSSKNLIEFKKYIKGFYAALDNISPYSAELNALSGSCLIPGENKN